MGAMVAGEGRTIFRAVPPHQDPRHASGGLPMPGQGRSNTIIPEPLISTLMEPVRCRSCPLFHEQPNEQSEAA